MELIDELLDDAKERMAKSVDSTRGELTTVRTGRASPHLLDRIVVDYYGAPTPLQTLAGISVPEPSQLAIKPYDRSALSAIEKAIQKSDLGLNPSNDGEMIRITIPQLNEERRKELVKVVHRKAEEARVAVRNVRRDVMGDIKDLLKEKLISQDDEKRAEVEIQKLTDKHIADIEQALQTKEKEVMQV